MMPLVDIVSVIVGSGIILTLIGLITVDGLGKKKKINTLAQSIKNGKK
jgi:hypothetical protein